MWLKPLIRPCRCPIMFEAIGYHWWSSHWRMPRLDPQWAHETSPHVHSVLHQDQSTDIAHKRPSCEEENSHDPWDSCIHFSHRKKFHTILSRYLQCFPFLYIKRYKRGWFVMLKKMKMMNAQTEWLHDQTRALSMQVVTRKGSRMLWFFLSSLHSELLYITLMVTKVQNFTCGECPINR